MATAYVNSTSLLDWQRTLGTAARDGESPCGKALARIGAAVEKYPERVPLRTYVELLESIGQRCRTSAIAWNVGLSVDLPLGTELDQVEAPETEEGAEAPDPDELEREIEDLRSRIERLGNVNHAALEELAEDIANKDL